MLKRLCLLILLAGFFVACRPQPKTPGALNIAVIPKATTGAFWQTVHRGAEQAAQDLGVNLVWVGTEREDQRAQQISIMDSQIANRIDGIVLAPLDGKALVKPVQEAVERKIPVVIMDSALEAPPELITSYVATDNKAGGSLAGEQMAKLLQGRGRVVVLRHQEGSVSTGQRETGFLETLKQYPEIQILSSEQYGGRDPQQAAENLLVRFSQKDQLEIDGVFCPNLTTTYGMLQALRRARKAGEVKLIGFDSDASLVQALQQKELHGLVLQDPYQIGYQGVTTLVSHLKGRGVPAKKDTALILATPENLKDGRIQALLTPTQQL